MSLLKPKENWEMQLDWRRELLQKDWNEEERVDHQKNEDFLADAFYPVTSPLSHKHIT